MFAVVQVVQLLFRFYMIMIFARIISSWIPELYESKLMQFVAFYVDPYLNFFKRFIPPLGMIDLSPIAALFCLSFIEGIFTNALLYFA
ncbi:YggT family protein [Criblamydia sequanensis]|uniref:Conserved putative membrane protein n=1 Tax=Candidatus Criblamydia sequanensis CRIB-18 TaxID=1437425 RepID=A0A090CZP2_9BACT|nr:YggT family protein [Criblamydia sequanensis]CDR34431.1 Conserved putative membrane protein [Criblamydia sequanensis CRIB-18]